MSKGNLGNFHKQLLTEYAMRTHQTHEPCPSSIPAIDVETAPECAYGDTVAVYGNTCIVVRELKE